MTLQFRPQPHQQHHHLLNGMEMVCSGDTDDAFSVHSEEIPSTYRGEKHTDYENPNTFLPIAPLNDISRVRHLVNSFEALLNPSGRGRVRRKWVFPTVQRPICRVEEDQNFDLNQYSYGGRDSDKLRVQRLSSSARELPLGKHGTNDQKHLVKFTPAQPFRLLTEQRGHIKEQEFMKKLKEMLAEEAKRRIPVAQGLPWTTDMPQILSKPSVKGRTKPLHIKLHTQIRAVERAEFDHFVADKLYFLEQQRLEEERLQKLLEEEEIKRLRKEMVPRAQIMPFFDRPFTPRRSTRRLTIPKEPKFHITHHRRECVSCNSL